MCGRGLRLIKFTRRRWKIRAVWCFVHTKPPPPFKPKDQNLNSHLLPLFISYRRSGEKLIKYQANSSCVIMSLTLMTTLFYKALGKIWCWSLVGLKELTVQKFRRQAIQSSVWTERKYWTVPCERGVRSNFLAGREFVRCRFERSLKMMLHEAIRNDDF